MLTGRLACAVIVTGFTVGLLSNGCGVEDERRSEYIASNLELFGGFRSVLVATEVSRDHIPYSFEESFFERPDGWGTVLTFELRDDSTSEDELRSRLRAAFSEWTASSDQIGLDFCNEGALIGFDFTRLRGEGTIRVYIDHEYARSGIRLTPC